MRLCIIYLYCLFTLPLNGHESVNPSVSFEGFGGLSVEKARFGGKVRELMVFEKAVIAVVASHVFINRSYYGEFKKAKFSYEDGVISIDGRVAAPVKLRKEVAIECFGVVGGREAEIVLPDGVRIIVDGTMRREVEVDEKRRLAEIRPLFENNHQLFHFEDVLIERGNGFWIICTKWKIPISSRLGWALRYNPETMDFVLVGE